MAMHTISLVCNTQRRSGAGETLTVTPTATTRPASLIHPDHGSIFSDVIYCLYDRSCLEAGYTDVKQVSGP